MMDATWLQITWYILLMVLIAGYAVLDGFDLGIGILSLFNRNGKERRLYLNAIAPVWDGNEVWLVTAGGALFAAFPSVYATVFSGFYLALVLVLLGLVARAISIEVRGKVHSERWQAFWDRMFGLGSLLPALLFAVAVGNILRGLPLSETQEFGGTFLGLLNPFSLLVGILGLAMFVTHGALYLAVKTTGDLRQRMLTTASRVWPAWVLLYVGATVFGFFDAPHLFEGTLAKPLFWLFFPILLVTLLYLPVAVKGRNPLRAFLTSSTAVAATVGLAATGLYPHLVPASGPSGVGLTATNASSSETTLMVMLVIAVIGMPLVLGYTFFIYRVFKGRVVLDEYSY